MENRIERFTLRIMIACFVAMMAFAPGTLLAGGSEKKAEGKDGIIASTASEDQKKKDSLKGPEKKEKSGAETKKGAN